MALVYLGYLRDDETPEPSAEEQSLFVTRRCVSIGLALVLLILLGLLVGPVAVVVVAVVSASWWAFATRADRRRAAAGPTARPDA
jgi:Flp pilus assembly protein TadB